MKQFNKLSIVIVSVLVKSVVATVNLCCAAIEVTNLGLLRELGYTGPEPINIAEPCIPLEDSWYDSIAWCELLPATCQTSLASADNLVGINCAPFNFTVLRTVELCCAQIVPTNDQLAEQLLSVAGYNGNVPVNIGLLFFQVGADSECPLLDLRCQEALLDNFVGVNCGP
ncbi:hypothetical protein B0H14DRAFT_2556536 [Mycena olivaceomarginata]|nr:hypothetical protein B0H14DRAFT_2556536 [Mycena olivaceomarginata]